MRERARMAALSRAVERWATFEESRQQDTAAAGPGFWIFAYGSLMWQPGFAYAERHRARLAGYRRCFCLYSVFHRGSNARPGLVLGLDRGGTCEGIAYRVAGPGAAATIAYLRAREQVTGAYREARLPVTLAGGEIVQAMAYVAEPRHPGYAGELPIAREAHLIRGARGRSGTNLDYLANTLNHLAELSIREPRIERVATAIGAFALHRNDPGSVRPRARSLVAVLGRAGPRIKGPYLFPGERRFIHRARLDSALS
jgi:glutathione-specific gamma-glutamylcyclotransferase